jgi:hypothetical protein
LAVPFSVEFDYALVFVALKRCDFKIWQAFRLTIDDSKYETVQGIISIGIAAHDLLVQCSQVYNTVNAFVHDELASMRIAPTVSSTPA